MSNYPSVSLEELLCVCSQLWLFSVTEGSVVVHYGKDVSPGQPN